MYFQQRYILGFLLDQVLSLRINLKIVQLPQLEFSHTINKIIDKWNTCSYMYLLCFELTYMNVCTINYCYGELLLSMKSQLLNTIYFVKETFSLGNWVIGFDLHLKIPLHSLQQSCLLLRVYKCMHLVIFPHLFINQSDTFNFHNCCQVQQLVMNTLLLLLLKSRLWEICWFVWNMKVL